MRVLAIVFFVIAFLVIGQLVRKRQLKEKYAILWLVLCVVTLVLLLFPRLLYLASEVVGVEVPANLLFALTLALLAGILVHLSWESSRTEERTRRLAEEVSLLRLRCTQLEDWIGHDQLTGQTSAKVSEDLHGSGAGDEPCDSEAPEAGRGDQNPRSF